MFVTKQVGGDWYIVEEGAPEGQYVCLAPFQGAAPREVAQSIVDALNAHYQTTDELVQIIRYWFVRVFGRTRELKTPSFEAMIAKTEKLLAAYPPRSNSRT